MPEFWTPPHTPRGMEVYNDYHRFLLVEGSRKSGKTIAVEHRLMRHACDNDGAIIGVFASSKAVGDVGVWADFIGRGNVVDQWIAAANGLAYAVEPKYRQDSKMAYFRIRTPPTAEAPLGGEAEFQMHSINNEAEVEKKFKSTRFSAIYVVEADNFKLRSTFDSLRMQLRALGVPESRYQMILDSNPPEEGTDHWLHDVFFKGDNPQFHRIHFGIDDNTFFTETQKREIYDTYAHDKTLLDRYYYGLWVKASVEGVFSDVFLPNIHVIGEVPKGSDLVDYDERDKWPILRPDQDAHQLEEGFDIGDVNVSYTIGVSRYNIFRKCVCFDVIDELAYNDTRASLDDLVGEILDRRAYWEDWQKRENGIDRIRWVSYSDSSSVRHRITVGGSEALEIYRISGRKIILGGVRKGSGSVGRRKDLVKRLLFEKRLYVSAICPNTIEMLRSIKGKPGMAIDPHSKVKHSFDSLSYWLGYSCPDANTRQLREKNHLSSFALPV